MNKFLLLLFFFQTAWISLLPGQSTIPPILSVQEQGELEDAWLKRRIETVLPDLMRRVGVDMWILVSREYNEDPILETMLPSTWMGARRTTILVIYDPGEGPLETLACARYGVGDIFQKAWDKEEQPDQWARLVELIEERDPSQIAINRGVNFGLADGLSAFHLERLRLTLPSKYVDRLVSVESLGIGWLETRIPEEMVMYRHIMQVAHGIIAEAFSEKVIKPNRTTTDEVVWYMRERARELGLSVWFHPTVDIQRAEEEELYAFSGRPESDVIRPGDLLHCDFGITYCGLNTDTQHNAYVLRPGETTLPDYLQEAQRQGMLAMDILTHEYETGLTGNQILAAALAGGQAAGLRPTIYSHPIGYHGHGAGPPIGLWDQQEGVPIRGDYPLYPNTAYSIELNTKVYIKEWDKDIRMMMEEDGYWDGETFEYIDGRQTDLYLIPRQ
ncbi:MAG: M24 family metallopeptidase [Bacteroidota bacterium]